VREAVEQAWPRRRGTIGGYGPVSAHRGGWWFLRTIGILAPLCVTSLTSSARVAIRYEVSVAHPERHLFHITMQIPEVTGEVTVQMPAWNALYQIRDFSAHVQQVEAFVGSDKAPLEKMDKQTWRINGKGTVTIRYATYWDEGGPFATQLNSEHAFINPAMILMYVPERRSEGVHLDMPDVPLEWKVASASLQRLEQMSRARNFGFDSASYDALSDAPIEAGKFEEFQVPEVSPAVWAVVQGDGWKRKQLEEELRRICAYELRLMDGAPFESYTFLVHLGKSATGAGGGMEHLNSTAISVRSEDEFLDVAAHEFFHLWNVKRIRPASLEPVDDTREQYTRALWFAEGVTSAYASYTLVRTHLWSKEQFYEDLSEQITDLESRPANRWQSAEQSSLDAWLEKYPLYNRAQNSVSYYTKGQILGVLLDILIRDRTDNQKSLDDVLRSMNEEFAKQGKTYRDSLDVRLTAEKVAGGSFEEFFQKYVSHADPLPYQKILSLAGLELRTNERKIPTLGFSAERSGNGALIVGAIDAEGGAGEAGLRVGDVIVNWNGSEPPRSIERWLYSQKKGSTLRLNVLRDDKNLTVEFRLGEVTRTSYLVKEDLHAGEKARRIHEGLLRGVTQPVTALIGNRSS
jgi:predicted metalloprotease with PDZ domain